MSKDLKKARRDLSLSCAWMIYWLSICAMASGWHDSTVFLIGCIFLGIETLGWVGRVKKLERLEAKAQSSDL